MFDLDCCWLHNVWPWLLLISWWLTLTVTDYVIFDLDCCWSRNDWPWLLLITWCLTLTVADHVMFDLDLSSTSLCLPHCVDATTSSSSFRFRRVLSPFAEEFSAPEKVRVHTTWMVYFCISPLKYCLFTVTCQHKCWVGRSFFYFCIFVS